MKKSILTLSIFSLLSFVVDNYIVIRISQQQLSYHWRNLESVKKILDESNLPHSQVKFIINTIDSLQKDISKNGRLDTTSIMTQPKK